MSRTMKAFYYHESNIKNKNIENDVLHHAIHISHAMSLLLTSTASSLRENIRSRYDLNLILSPNDRTLCQEDVNT